MAHRAVLTDVDGGKILLDTKNKVLPQDGTPAREDLYQMYAYGSAGTQTYDDLMLLYPTNGVVHRTFVHEDATRLHVRQFDPRKIYDPKSRGLNAADVVNELNGALSNPSPAATPSS